MKRLLPNIEMKRIIVTILALLMMAGGAYAYEPSGGGDGRTAKTPYVILTPEDLLLLSTDYSSDNDLKGSYKYFELGADIDMSEVDGFIPIGGYSYTEIAPGMSLVNVNEQLAFVGSFDGKGHTIKNLSYKVTATWKGNLALGLFGIVGKLNSTSEIKNLTLENITVPKVSKGVYVGGLIGRAYNGTLSVSNCHVKNSSLEAFTAGSAVMGEVAMGGLVGYAKDMILTITGCTVEGVDLTGSNFSVGGVVGLGGIGLQLNHSYFSGEITTKCNSGTGGLVGRLFGGKVENCGAAGVISADGTEKADNIKQIGGLIGYLEKDGASVKNCFSSVNVKAFSEVGGLVGWAKDITTIENCYSVGKLSKRKSEYGVEKVNTAVGFLDEGPVVKNVYAQEDVLLDGIIGSGNGYAGEPHPQLYMQSGCFAEYMNKVVGETVWYEDVDGVNDGYPIPAGLKISANSGSGSAPSCHPIVRTDSVSGVGSSSAKAHGSFAFFSNPDQPIVDGDYGFEVSKKGVGVWIKFPPGEKVSEKDKLVSVSGSITGLESETSYELRAFVIYEGKTYYGKIIEFNTSGREANSEGFYEIWSREDMEWLADCASKGLTKGKKYKLMNDITDSVRTVIGTEAKPFEGLFRGDGYCVTVAINMPNEANVGVFGVVSSEANESILDLSVRGYVNGGTNAGAVCGNLKSNSAIVGCCNAATVRGTNAGGIVGTISDKNTEIKFCVNIGEISGTEKAGGIACWQGKIVSCLSSGYVHSGKFAYGIAGGGDARECVSAGHVKGEEESVMIGPSKGSNMYDKQMYYGRSASGASEKTFEEMQEWTHTDWFSNSGYYPVPKRVKDNVIAKLAAVPVVFTEDGDLISSVSDSILLKDKCFSGESVAWSYDDEATSALFEKGDDATYYIPKKKGESIFTLSCSGLERRIPFKVTDSYFSGGLGTEEKPYLISTKEDMEELARRVEENKKGSATSNWSAGKYFRVIADIDGVTTVVGSEEKAFEGVFDGNEHVISLNIKSDKSNVGMFGCVDGGIVHEVSVTGTVSGTDNVGAICGYLKDGSIRMVSNSANVTGKITVGGICGNSSGSLVGVTNIAVVSGVNYVGGLCGVSEDSLCVCMNSGIVKGKEFVGGISGKHQSGVVRSILSVGQVQGDKKTDAVSPVDMNDIDIVLCDEQLVTVGAVSESKIKFQKTEEIKLNYLTEEAGASWRGAGGVANYGYPRVNFESDINELAQMTVILDAENEVDNVTRSFKVSVRDGFVWSSKNGKVSINENGEVSLVGVGEDVLVVSKGNMTKRIEINIQCLPFKGHVLNLDSCGSVTYKGKKYTEDRSFEDVITGESYCDTFATVNIKVRKTYAVDTLVAGCGSVSVDGEVYDKDTTITLMKETVEGCDSIVNVTVNVFKPLMDTLTWTVCDKYVYEYFDKSTIVITQDTLFNDTIRKKDFEFECDSIIRTVSVNIGAKDTTINLFGCNKLTLGDQTFEKDTVLYDSLKAASGCDSVVIRNIDVYKTKVYTIEESGCDSVVVRSEVKDRTLYITKDSVEIFSDTLLSKVTGCDSVIYIYKLKVKGHDTPEELKVPIDTSGCDTVFFEGRGHTKSRVIRQNLTNISGCDSSIVVNITVHKSVFEDSVIHACDSLLYVTKTGEEIWFKESTTYSDRLKGVVPVCGCDSVWNVEINIHKTLRVDSTLKDCDSVVYVKDEESMVFYKDTVFMDTIKSRCGLCDCDSVIRKMNIIVSKSTPAEYVETRVLVGCDSLLFESEMDGVAPVMVYSDTMMYDTLVNVFGCDSIVPVSIKINLSSDTNTVLIHACDSLVYKTSDGFENVIKRDQELLDNLKNVAGCDSVVLLDVRIHKVKFREEAFSGCDSVVYERLNGEHFAIKKDTVFNDTLKSEVCDCDSLIREVSVHVSYSTPASEIETVVINGCDSLVYKNYKGEELVFRTSTMYMDSMVNSSGCDSIVPVQINISASSQVTNKKVYACEKFEYVSASGMQYRITEGTSTVKDTLVNKAGCDSVVVMDVRVVKVAVETPEPIVGCDVVSYTYFSGEERNFVRDTMFYDVLKSKECDCDSVKRVVSIKVNNATPAESIDTVYVKGCSSVTYKDVEYTESVILHDSLHNVYGCDSVVPVRIDVLKESKRKIFEEACVSYRYVNANNEIHIFTKDTVFTDNTFKNSVGCDSVIVLDVKVVPQKYDSLKYVACGSLSLGDSVYTESTSWKVVPNDPCDPIKVYIITINPVYEDSVKLEGCSIVEYKDQTFTKDTAFVESNTSILGCDSIIYVDITVHQPALKTLYKSSCEFVEHEGIIYTESTEVEDTYINEFGCVSPLKVVIEVLPPLYGVDRKVGCGSVWFKDSLYTESTLVMDTLASSVTGCDSIVEVSIDVYRPVRTVIEIDSCNQLTYKGVVYTETTFLEPDTLETVYGCDSIVEVHLLVRRCFPYPIVVNKYNWILLCNNTLMEKDFEYKAYQWYKDDQIVLGATKSYYTENKELDGCYQVGVTLANDTVLLSEKICIDAEHKFELYPNPVNRGHSVYIKCGFDKSELEGARVEVFNPLGIRVRNERARFNENDEIVVSPMTESGTYYVKITVSADMAFGARFIVK
ncbi:MAG: T9SS type A sorting domain-containing protein [Paludibacteraceae bacterium]|nr:T9SS type A sorting domain-containing protein [Paludibacteraceae bacterium]